MSDKTEDPTPKRLRKAREEGDSGVSTFASQSIGFLVAIALAPTALAALTEKVHGLILSGIEAAKQPDVFAIDASGIAMIVLSATAPLLVAVGITTGAASFVQTGGVFASKKLGLKLDRLNFFQGIKQLFSGPRLFSVVRAIAGASVVLWLAYRGLRAHAADLAHLTRLGNVGLVAGSVAQDVCYSAALVGIAIGAVDLLVVRRSWFNRLKMTKDEVRREHKESEGDPQTKQARERARHEMLAAATVANVRNASVVVVNPTHLACALRYEETEGDEAPVIVASGEGDLARQIVEAANAYGIPVIRDVPLAQALIELPIGEVIPEVLYEAVAEILREAWEEKPKLGG